MCDQCVLLDLKPPCPADVHLPDRTLRYRFLRDDPPLFADKKLAKEISDERVSLGLPPLPAQSKPLRIKKAKEPTT